MVKYHSRMAAQLRALTSFRLMNSPLIVNVLQRSSISKQHDINRRGFDDCIADPAELAPSIRSDAIDRTCSGNTYECCGDGALVLGR
mmetsp:Transcript_17324/g.19992  ORF Transcript_17324/g.19992 Transcript_17324/m.19992 type:complete len:87 (+) Transcript_17324:53-313(+)